MHSVLHGNNLTQRTDLTESTVNGYLNAAVSWLKAHHGVICPIKQDSHLHPLLRAQLEDRRNWRRPQPKKEAISGEILDAMRSLAQRTHPDSREAAVYDWCRLGLFTGSRLSEYAQSKLPRGSHRAAWATIPNSPDVPPDQRGMPIAFIAADFTFWSAAMTRIPHSTAILAPSSVAFVHVCFRCDKSKHNFLIRKYRRIPFSHLCPVAAALSVVARGQRLSPSPQAPLGFFRDRTNRLCTVRRSDMQKVMRDACILAYPDPNHCMRLNIHRILSHSIRVFACVALHNSGVPLDDICFRLRWNSDAVRLYIRDSPRLVDDLTQRALLGAHVDTPTSTTNHTLRSEQPFSNHHAFTTHCVHTTSSSSFSSSFLS